MLFPSVVGRDDKKPDGSGRLMMKLSKKMHVEICGLQGQL